jgi:hypothetical protein
MYLELKCLYIKKQKLYEQLYRLHLICAKKTEKKRMYIFRITILCNQEICTVQLT